MLNFFFFLFPLLAGILDSKTRVLVTHHLQYLPNADHVVVLDNGRVTGSGTYSELLASGIDFIGLLGDGNERKVRAAVNVGDCG